MNKWALLICFIASLTSIKAAGKIKKEQENIKFGFLLGTANTTVSNIEKVLVSESYYTNYSFTNNSMWSLVGGVFINCRFDQSISAIHSELSYGRLGTTLSYSDIMGLNYDLALKYEYINFELFYRAYIFNGLNIGVGPRIGFNLTPDGLFYTSNGEDLFGSDIQIQQQMRDVLKGRTNFALGASLGYDFENGISLDARYYYGISDVMETEVNNFHFIENKNTGNAIQLTIGYALPYSFKSFKSK